VPPRPVHRTADNPAAAALVAERTSEGAGNLYSSIFERPGARRGIAGYFSGIASAESRSAIRSSKRTQRANATLRRDGSKDLAAGVSNAVEHPQRQTNHWKPNPRPQRTRYPGRDAIPRTLARCCCAADWRGNGDRSLPARIL